MKMRRLFLLFVAVIFLIAFLFSTSYGKHYHSGTDILACKERIIIPRENLSNLIQTIYFMDYGAVYCPHTKTLLVNVYKNYDYTVFLGNGGSIHDICGEDTVTIKLKEPIMIDGTKIEAVVIFPTDLTILE